MLTAAILPKFVDGSSERRQRLIRPCFDVLISGGAALPLFAVVFARPVIVLIAGKSFASGATPLVLLSFYAALSCPAAVFMDGLVYLRAERAVLRTMLLGTVATLVVAGAAIPFFAATAAAVALIVGAAVIVAFGAAAFRSTAGFGVSLAKCARLLLVSASLGTLYLVFHLAAGYDPHGGWLMVPEMLALLVIYGLSAFWATRIGGQRVAQN